MELEVCPTDSAGGKLGTDHQMCVHAGVTLMSFSSEKYCPTA